MRTLQAPACFSFDLLIWKLEGGEVTQAQGTVTSPPSIIPSPYSALVIPVPTAPGSIQSQGAVQGNTIAVPAVPEALISFKLPGFLICVHPATLRGLVRNCSIWHTLGASRNVEKEPNTRSFLSHLPSSFR